MTITMKAKSERSMERSDSTYKIKAFLKSGSYETLVRSSSGRKFQAPPSGLLLRLDTKYTLEVGGRHESTGCCAVVRSSAHHHGIPFCADWPACVTTMQRPTNTRIQSGGEETS